MTNTSPNLADSINKEKPMTDVKTVLSDVETLLKQAASSSGEKAAKLRKHGIGMLRQAKEKTQNLQDAVVHRDKAAVCATDDYAHDRPWQTVGAAAGVGLLIDLLLSRKWPAAPFLTNGARPVDRAIGQLHLRGSIPSIARVVLVLALSASHPFHSS